MVDDLLFLAHEFLALLQTIGFALNIDDRTVMQDTVEDSGDDGDICKDRENVLLEVKTVEVLS